MGRIEGDMCLRRACLFVPKWPCLFYRCSTWDHWPKDKAFWNNYHRALEDKSHICFVLCFIAAIKVFINLQTPVSTSKACLHWICLCTGSVFNLNAKQPVILTEGGLHMCSSPLDEQSRTHWFPVYTLCDHFKTLRVMVILKQASVYCMELSALRGRP